MDLPIAIGVTNTYLYSLYVTASGTLAGDVYWDTVVNFLFVILVGRFLESISKRKAVAATQRLLDLQPGLLRSCATARKRWCPSARSSRARRSWCAPGRRFPWMGKSMAGRSSVDESMLTGESDPVTKPAGASVCAGTLNGPGPLQVKVQGLLRDTALGRIIRLVEDAQASKAPIQCVADRVVPWFVAVTLGLAGITFALWVGDGVEKALMAATAVLIITCPCAFGMSTPMAIAVASGLGARLGILVKNGAVLEGLSSIDHFVFDKTGTLTEGHPAVTAVADRTARWDGADGEALGPGPRANLRRLAALEQLSEHPVAGAVLSLCARVGIDPGGQEVTEVEALPGLGIRGTVDGARLVAGTAEWLRRNGVEPDQVLVASVAFIESVGGSALRLAVDGREVLVIGVEDRLRPDAAEVVAQLKADGIRVTLLTGDRRAAAERIAARLGGVEVFAQVLPGDKDRIIAKLQSGGQRVAMVGDGVNDAPALVRADVGIAMGSGTDVSIASADIVLLSSELSKVRQAAALSRRTLRTIRQNIRISILYNVIMVPLAMAALVTPLVAAVSMPLSSLAVIGNSARIHSLFRERRRPTHGVN